MTSNDDRRMSLMQHLVELRVRLTRAAIAIFVGFFVAYLFHIELFEIVIAPVKEALAERGIYSLQAIHVTESILVYLKLSVVAGIIGASPFVSYQFWAFIGPGLTPDERKYVTPVALFSTLFFFLGVAFSYYVLLPFVTGFLTDLTMSSGSVNLQVTMANVFSFSLLSMLIFGVIFELPIAMFFLSLFGIFNYKQFASFFRYFIVISFVLSAVLTPPDPVSQILMAIPMSALYSLGILISFLAGERKVDEEGNMAPVGNRLWSAVFICLLLLGSAIYAIVYFMMPGPTPMNVLPANTAYAVGMKPDSTSDLGIHDAVANTAFDDPALTAAIVDTIDNKDINELILFGDNEGHQAIIMMREEIDVSAITKILDQESSLEGEDVMESPDHEGVSLAILSDKLALVGHSPLVASALKCFDDETTCLVHEESHLKQIDDLRTRAPGWLYLASFDGKWKDALPVPDETKGVERVAGLVELSDGVTLLLEVPFASEANATAYRSRVNLWRQQTKSEASRRETSQALNNEIDSLISIMEELAKNNRASLEAISLQPFPEGSDLTAFNAKQKSAQEDLDRLEQAIQKIKARPKASPTQASSSSTTLFDVIPATELRDWTVEASEKTVTFRLQLTVDGLRSLLSR